MRRGKVPLTGSEVRVKGDFWNQAEEVEYPRDKTLHQLFEEQAARTPGNRAVIFKDQTLSYQELNERSSRLAQVLMDKGVGSDHIVAIMVERSFEMIIGLLAIFKAGGAYLPIDPHYPEERIRFMLCDSGAKMLITRHGLFIDGRNANDQNNMAGNPVLNFGDLNFEFVSSFEFRGSDLAPETKGVVAKNRQPATSLAYVIYTSGSTGKPKGVLIQHRSVVNRLHWMQKKYPLNESDTLLQKTPYFFDVSVWELFWWFFAGACLCFMLPGFEKFPQAIVETVKSRGVSVIHFVPSMLSAFLGYVENSAGEVEGLASLKRVFASGEILKPAHVKRFNQILHRQNGTRLVNLYGPTEATVDVSYFDCPTSTDIQEVPIGRPIDNHRLCILDKDMRQQPEAAEGELCISGVGLARGYLNNPELSAEKFIDWNIGPQRSQGEDFIELENRIKIYRSGDLARQLPDGNIAFVARMDKQVKIRGLRIELGEIEAVLAAHPAVQDSVVRVKETSETIVTLVAYAVSKKPVSAEELRKYMKTFLPDYMVPAAFVFLDALPLTSSGKLDRRALA